jgi:hypothetical protein
MAKEVASAFTPFLKSLYSCGESDLGTMPDWELFLMAEG